jgi:hypothetical protein
MFGEMLKEDLHIMWHKADLLLMPKRKRFPKLMDNSKLMMADDINGI